ncbi:MAG: ABC transporter permease subunit [Arcobacteraceae bacterium]|nr:ABC transporter permease subunit [Arcobacteraceae bacterium]
MNKKLPLFAKISIGLLSFWLLLFAFLPNLLVLVSSFLTKGETEFLIYDGTLSNYAKIADPLYLSIFLSSFKIAIITTISTLILAYPFAFILATTAKKYRSILLLLVIIPFWTSSLVRTYALIAILKTKGLLNALLLYLGFIDTPLEIMYTQTAVYIGMTYTLLPFMILPIYASIEKIDMRLLEAAKDLGASTIAQFTKIIIPLSLPGIIAGVTLVFLPSLGMFFIADILGGAKDLIVGSFIRNQFLTFRDWPFGSSAAVVLTLIMFFMIYLYASASTKIGQKDSL